MRQGDAGPRSMYSSSSPIATSSLPLSLIPASLSAMLFELECARVPFPPPRYMADSVV
jgi:hypothetical protein